MTHAHWIPGWLVLALLATSGPVCATPDKAAAMRVTPAADGRSFSVTAPGWRGRQGGFGACIVAEGEEKQLTSAAGTTVGPPRNLTEETPSGTATVIETTLRFEKEQVDLLFRLGWVPGVPGVLAQTGIRNNGRQAVELASLTAFDLTIEADGKPEQWLITGFHSPVSAITALIELARPLDVHEAGGFYHRSGQGFWFGAVGTPTAYVNARFVPAANGRAGFNLTSEMSGVRVDPGEIRWGQQAVVLVEAPEQAVARWAEWVGKTHGARTSKGALAGWNNWNFIKHKDLGKEVLEVVAAVRESDGRLRPGVIQMETMTPCGQDVLDAPWLPEVAQHVGGIGARFGLRLAFEPSLNPALEGRPMEIGEITAAVRRAVHGGFNYLKISCGPAPKRVAGEKRSAFEIQRDIWSAIRQAAGEETYLLFCGAAYRPDRAVVGCVDASRVGPDAGRRRLPALINDLRPYGPLNGRWFAVDHDVYYLAANAEGMVVADGQAAVQTWRSMVGLSGGAAITADPWYWGDFRENWHHAEVMTPPATEDTRMLGFGTRGAWRGLVSHIRRDWVDSTVALVWSVGDRQQASNRLDFAAAGMDPNRRYAVWSFWDNQFLGIAKGSWVTPLLAESASEHLCFTDLDRTPNQPVLIGSNLHIYCGAAEIKGVSCTRSSMRIDLTDAGAHDGDLWVYSRWPLAFKAAIGCALKEVVSAGDNVWRISLVDRQHGQPQRLDLEIRLPFTHQAWFWLVVALVVASLALAAWRYGVGLRLERLHGLDEERARIARNIHDDLGASLTEITLLSELAQSGEAPTAEVRSDMRKIAARARQLTRALDTTVWAVNPRNDTLGSLVSYTCQRAEEFLKAGGIRCRMDVPSQVPEQVLTATVRHNVFLVVKEACHNVVKHSGASEVELRMATRANGLTIVIEDNGKGLTPDANVLAGAAARDGLSNMRQRAADIGATLEVCGTPGRGTRIQLDIPFHSP